MLSRIVKFSLSKGCFSLIESSFLELKKVGARELSTINEIKVNLQELVQSRLPKPYDPVVLDLLQSCGPDLVAYTQKERHHLLDNVWMNLLKAKIVQHPVYYNRLLELFIADDHHLSPSDFLDSMEANSVIPNPTTLALILESYCMAGQMDKARVVLNHFKSVGMEMDKETSRATYKSLSVGMAIENNLDGIQNVCTSMSRGGILPDYDYYSAILAAFAQSGNLDAINKILDMMLRQGLHPYDTTFRTILDGLARGNHVDIIPMIFLYMKHIVWKAEDFRKLAVLCASRGQLDASVKLLECLYECGTLQTGILTTTTSLILNHVVSYCKQDTAKMATMIGKVIDLGIPSTEAFEYLLFNNQFCDSYPDIVRIMWNRGEPVRSVYLYPALAKFVKNNQPDRLHSVMELLRDTGLGADAMVIQYVGKYIDKKMSRSKRIDTVMDILQKYNLLDIDTTVLSLYEAVVEEWRLPEYFATNYNRMPQKARHPKHLAQLLSQVVHYERNKLYMLPKLFQMLYADITDHDDFTDRILQMFFLGVVESYPISTTISLVNKFVEMGMEDCISQIIFSCISHHIRRNPSSDSEVIKNFISWMISTGRWESMESNKLRHAHYHGNISESIELFNEIKRKGKVDGLAYSYHLMALSTNYRVYHKEINEILQDCYASNIQILPMAITKLIIGALSSKDLKMAERILKDTQEHCGYKPGASVITKLAHTYSNQGNVDGVLTCNKQLREIDSGYTLQSYSDLVYAYKVQGHVDHIMSVINEMEENKFSINSNIVSCLMRVYCSNGDIAGAVNAYYQTYHLASPKKSVLRSLLDRCVASRDRINAELVMSALLHFGAHPGYVKTSLVFAHLQAGELDEARHIIKAERIKFLGVKRCMNAAVTWFYNNNLDAITSLLILCHEHGWPIYNDKVDIKELIVTYYHSKHPSNAEALKTYDSLEAAGVPLPPVLHKIAKKL